jgi:SAM-dependent methyltransferase
VSRNALVKVFGWPALVVQGDALFVERVAWVRRRLRSGPMRTLDAGCGVGALTMLAARKGNDALGLTFAPADAELATSRAALVGAAGARFEVVDLRELAAHVPRLGVFDQIIACEVIEHLNNDAGLVANLSALLKPGGQLLLTTPHANHHPVYGEVVSPTEDGGHVRFGYTHDDLKRLFDAAGLQVKELGFLNGFISQKLFSVYLRLYRVHPKVGWLLTLPFRPLRVFDGLIHRITGYPYMSVTAVATKPEATA